MVACCHRLPSFWKDVIRVDALSRSASFHKAEATSGRRDLVSLQIGSNLCHDEVVEGVGLKVSANPEASALRPMPL
jgi:hypothetical protein